MDVFALLRGVNAHIPILSFANMALSNAVNVRWLPSYCCIHTSQQK